MKSYSSFILALIPLYFLLLCYSCNDEEKNDGIFYTNEVLPAGEQTTSLNLSPGETYYLNDNLIMTEGTELVISEGTKIIANSQGSDIFIAILMGAKINIHGTASNPVVIASENGRAGDWKGIFIFGEGVTTAGQNIESEIEFSGFLYGGYNNNDSSGSIEYLVVQNSGASLCCSATAGITFCAVGSKTKLENIAVINGGGDGLSFFGGAAKASNVYIENCEDDALDWTEGWKGEVTNAYILHTIPYFSTALEGDKVNSNPVFTNITAISSEGGIALQFKQESGATVNNLYLEGYDKTIDMKGDGPLENILIDNVIANPDSSYSKGSKVDISDWNWIL